MYTHTYPLMYAYIYTYVAIIINVYAVQSQTHGHIICSYIYCTYYAHII